jgi:delta 1-pyrroline-5-carboxylate dehydrogenase
VIATGSVDRSTLQHGFHRTHPVKVSKSEDGPVRVPEVTRSSEERPMDKLQLRNFVDGQSRDAVDGRTSDLLDPVTGEVYATAPLSGESDVDAAYGAATRAFETWRDTTPAERQRLLLKLAVAMEGRAGV